MKKFGSFNVVMGLLFVIVMLWTFAPTLARVDSSAGSVPIAFGTEAGGGGAQVEEPVSADTPQSEGVFIPYTLFNALCVFIGSVVIMAFLSSPPWVQNIFPPILDVARSTLEYIKNRPGTQFDPQLQQVINTLNDVERRLPAKPTDPPVSADGTPYAPPYTDR